MKSPHIHVTQCLKLFRRIQS